MKYVMLVIVALVLTGCASHQGESHSSLVAKEALTKPNFAESVNYLKLRTELGWSDEYNAKCVQGRPLSLMSKAMTEAKWQQAANLGLAWLEKCPIDIRGHLYMSIALRELGQEQGSQDHIRWTHGLMDSIVASGDGKSSASAFEVISIAEEYDVMYLFGLKVTSQSLISGEPMCDLLVGTDEFGEEVSLYFNPAAHFARLSKML